MNIGKLEFDIFHGNIHIVKSYERPSELLIWKNLKLVTLAGLLKYHKY